ncbi:class I SAM-dependent methyltransferase [Botrimarina sp.]|uniref:class I SAM-dependent methyltransferase n=1 Tax=Botrimarina sp. TaxID=2795802 RepID=UPI0032F09A23
MSTTAYRWDARQAAEDYDRAGPVIHPLYDEVQRAVVAALPEGVSHVVDLGGGSGRLAERILATRPAAAVTVVDPSAAFLRLAAERLHRQASRVRLVCSKAQDDWPGRVAPPGAIVSTSALHHLEGEEKQAVFAACRAALPPGGVLVNGDEYRPPSDALYRGLLEEWGEHMDAAVATGAIPDTFRGVIDKWRRRNLGDFGGPRASGDDCHETVEEQIARLYGAGFADVSVAFRERLWGVLVAQKA